MREAAPPIVPHARTLDHERLDALWARVQAGGEGGAAARGEFAQRLLERRRERARRAFRMRWDSGWYELAWVVAVLATAGVAPGCILCSIILGPLGPVAGAAVGAAAIVAWVAVVVMSRRRRELYRRVSGDVSCGSCGYDLRRLDVGLSVRIGGWAGLGGVRIATGPPRCPECGSCWPLIPPPEHGLVRRPVCEPTG